MSLTTRDWQNAVTPPSIDATYLNELDNEVRRLDNEKVTKSGNEIIAGIKTFNQSPLVPTPTLNTQIANKQYVDDSIPIYSLGDVISKSLMVSGETFINFDVEKIQNTNFGEWITYKTLTFKGLNGSSFKCLNIMDGIGEARILLNDVVINFKNNTGESIITTHNINNNDVIKLQVKLNEDGGSCTANAIIKSNTYYGNMLFYQN